MAAPLSPPHTQLNVCFYETQYGGCRNGDACPFVHGQPNAWKPAGAFGVYFFCLYTKLCAPIPYPSGLERGFFGRCVELQSVLLSMCDCARPAQHMEARGCIRCVFRLPLHQTVRPNPLSLWIRARIFLVDVWNYRVFCVQSATVHGQPNAWKPAGAFGVCVTICISVLDDVYEQGLGLFVQPLACLP